MRKIPSGVYGLNRCLDGGINEHSTTVVIGSSGAGKTTFATQYVRRGLELGQEGIFVSLDENKEQIIKEAVEMGWKEIVRYIEQEQLVFIDASGRDFSEFIKKELPSFVSEWKGANARIAIDPLTPVLWAAPDRYEQRDLIGFLLKETRSVGTVLATLEEHGAGGDLSGPETIIPMYLADCVIHLRYRALDAGAERMLKIVKCRNSRHSELSHPYIIIQGLGIVLQHSAYEAPATTQGQRDILRALRSNASRIPGPALERLERLISLVKDGDLRGIEASDIAQSLISEYEVG
ncbi:MAG: ATPase domain-containing protein [Candidatus Thermoplasmatota archaeon]